MSKPNSADFRTSEQFCDPEADVIFKSSDGVLFRIHKQNLHSTCGAFPPAKLSTFGENVSLEEAADVLELLFAFVYPRQHPLLEDLSIATLVPLAEAAEKYQVFAAMGVCFFRMKQEVAENPIQVLNYAVKHNYPDLMEQAAFLVMGLSLTVIAALMDDRVLRSWLIYNQKWLDFGQEELRTYRSHSEARCCSGFARLVERNGIISAIAKHEYGLSCRFYLDRWSELLPKVPKLGI